MKEHKGTSRLERDVGQRKSGNVKGVEKLHRVYVCIVPSDLVHTHHDGLLPRESIEDGLIELIYGIIFGGEDGAFKEEAIWLVALVDAWINCVYQTFDGVLRKMHALRQFDSLVWSKVGTIAHLQQPSGKSVTFRGAVQTHVLGEMQDLYILPQLRLA
jgi:hypothetical protein